MGGYIKGVTGDMRKKLTNLLGHNNYKLWLTEAGWSSPGVQNAQQQDVVRRCPEWAGKEAMWRMYKNVMEWDLTLDDGTKAADHIFYFTLRDSRGESFGLVSDCWAKKCKIDGQF